MSFTLSALIQDQLTMLETHYVQTATQNELAAYLILSVSDGESRSQAVIFVKNFATFKSTEALLAIETQLTTLQAKFEQPLKWAKLEWLTEAVPMTWKVLQTELTRYKRNYFRSGIAFPSKRNPTDTPWLLATETELNAYAALYNGSDVPTAAINDKNLNAYLKARFGSKTMPDLTDEMPIYLFKTAGIFFDAQTAEVCQMSTLPRTQGRRALPPLSTDSLSPLIDKITAYLGSQVKENGLYEYGHFPCFGRTIGTYNTLRHASSTYALLEGYEFCRDERVDVGQTDLEKVRREIELALDHLTQQIIRHYPNDLAYVVEIDEEIKLGANSVAILALVKYQQVFADSPRNADYLQLAEKLANGILAMQQADGRFVHILDAKTLAVTAESRIIYYDGEAAFALMRLYGITKNERWLSSVCRAFDYFIAADHHKAHDHWLSYCSNELVQHKPERKYFEFAVNNVKGYVNFIRKRITTFPTLLELSMAFHKMLLKLDEFPQYVDVLNGFDVAGFYQALHTRANYLLNGVFFPELAMHYKKPSTVLYGCFIRHHAFRVRIDDVEHYLSGFVAYHQFLKEGKYPKTMNNPINSSYGVPLSKEGLVAATGGKWAIEPDSEWQADGLSIFPKRFRKGHIIVARGKNMDKGYLPPVAVKSLVLKGASAIVCDDASIYADYGVPVLQVANVKNATIDIGSWVRKQYQGSVIGVTGSAGKTTTVAMLAHALEAFGEVGQSLDSANLPAGIAWNLSMMAQTAPHWVLEMAIGSMDVNSQMVQPDLAIITNIAPAHLEYHKTVEMIAHKKARIFEGMKPQTRAIVCRDIEQFDILSEKAKAHHLQITTYGEHPEADIRLLSIKSGVAEISLFGQSYSFKMKAKGRHIVLNALAVLAVVHHRGLDVEKALKQLVSFKAVEGRGETFKLQYQGKTVTVIDEAYNANPISMKAALETFDELRSAKKNKLAIIGDMLELGNECQELHLAMLPQLKALKVREFVLVGPLSKVVCEQLSESGIRATHFDAVELLKDKLGDIVQDGDSVLIKASHGVGLQKLFEMEKVSV